MGFSNFRLNVVARVALLAGSLLVAIWGWTVASWVATKEGCAWQVAVMHNMDLPVAPPDKK